VGSLNWFALLLSKIADSGDTRSLFPIVNLLA